MRCWSTSPRRRRSATSICCAHLVGDDKINYFGSSYGTRIGALYAELYPTRVGRMVLDGSVNISGEDRRSPRPRASSGRLINFAAWCAAESCRLGDTRAEVLRRVKSYLEELDQQPMPVGRRMLTQQHGVEGVIYSMYGGRRSWLRLRDSLVAAIFDGDARGLLVLADLSNFRRDDGSYGQISYSFPAVRCLDSQDDSVREVERRYDRVSRRRRCSAARWGRPDLRALAGASAPPTADHRRRRRPPDRGDRDDR